MTQKEKDLIETAEYDGIIIIGNGFDLNLGLKTRYSDFINSDHFQQKKEDNMLFQYLDTQNVEKKGWIDAEIELKNYTKLKPENYYDEFIELKNTLTQYLKDATDPASDSYREIYKKDSEAKKFLNRVAGLNFLIFNFNYTRTVEDLLFHFYHGDDTLYQDAIKRIIHVHGSIENNDIIFGIEDKSNIDEEYIFLKKSVNTNFCNLDIEQILQKSTKNVIFFGYSLGITDYTYFRDFFRSLSHQSFPKQTKDIIVFYYGLSNYYDIYKRIDDMSQSSVSGLKQNHNLTLVDLIKETV